MSEGARAGAVLVVGLGNRLRGDDGIGVLAAERVGCEPLPEGVEVRVHEGEPIALLALWEGYAAVVVLDAVRSGAAAGTLHRFDVSAQAPALAAQAPSSHAVSALEAIELARALGRLPERIVVLAVEGSEFRAGAEMTPRVSAATSPLARAAREEAAAARLAGAGEGARARQSPRR